MTIKGSAVLSTIGALGLILAGTVGNLYDRVTLGKVIDFLLFHYQGHAFPAFNVADSAITVGAGLLILDSIWGKKHAAAANRGSMSS